MNKLIRRSALPVLLLLILASCGTNQEVDTSAGSHGLAKVAAVAKAAATTTTTLAPSGVPLSQLPVVDEGISPMNGPIKMNAVVYDNSVYDSFDCSNSVVWVFDLNRSYDKLTGVVGVDDASLATDNATVTISGDNNQVLSTTVASLGKVTPISVSLSGMLRLRIQLTRSSTTCVPTTGYSTTVAIGNATLTKVGK